LFCSCSVTKPPVSLSYSDPPGALLVEGKERAGGKIARSSQQSFILLQFQRSTEKIRALPTATKLPGLPPSTILLSPGWFGDEPVAAAERKEQQP
jgi:hypothetical protein